MDSVIYTFYVGGGGSSPSPVTYASHFNTTDGYSNAVPDEFLTRTPRSISDPHGDYEILPFGVDSVNDGTQSNSFTVAPPEEFSIIDNSSTTLTVELFQGTTLIDSLSFTITGDTTQSSSYITAQITNFQADNDKYKANLSVQFNLPSRGVYTYSIEHNDGGDGVFTYNSNPVMYDDNAQAISASGSDIVIVSPTLAQYSGVNYYTTGTQVRIPITVDNPNFATWPSDDIILNIYPDFPVSPQTVDIHTLTGWSADYDLASATYDQVLTVDVADQYAETSRYDARYYDWFSHAFTNPGTCYLWWTYTDNATDNYEDFTSESCRVTSSFGAWDSSQNVLSYDGGNGLIVCHGTELRYQARNFSSCTPPGPNYVEFNIPDGRRYYYRCFRHDNWSHSNGLFRFTGTNIDNENLFGPNPAMYMTWGIEISLDGVNWYDCTRDYAGGYLNDGDGCRINPDSHPLPECEFTLGPGGHTDASTGCGWGIWVRVWMERTSGAYGSEIILDSIELVNWV